MMQVGHQLRTATNSIATFSAKSSSSQREASSSPYWWPSLFSSRHASSSSSVRYEPITSQQTLPTPSPAATSPRYRCCCYTLLAIAAVAVMAAAAAAGVVVAVGGTEAAAQVLVTSAHAMKPTLAAISAWLSSSLSSLSSLSHSTAPPSWDPSPSAPPSAGILLGWTAPGMAFQLGLPDSPPNATWAEGAIRVGGPLARLGVVQVASGGHTLALATDGRVYSWGQNWDERHQVVGQLGRKGRHDWPLPVEGVGQGSVGQVATGRFHSLALTKEGGVLSWGDNRRGQLGREADELSAQQPRPVTGLPSDASISAIAACPFASFAITSSGRLFTWGANYLSEVSAAWGDASSAESAAAAADDGSGQQVAEQQSEKEGLKEAVRRAAAVREVPLGLSGGDKLLQVACGDSHWVARTEQGKVLTCSTGFDAAGYPLPSSSSSSSSSSSLLSRLGRTIQPVHVSTAGFNVHLLNHHLDPSSAPALSHSSPLNSPFIPGPVAGPLSSCRAKWVAAAGGVSVAECGGEVLSWGEASLLLGRDVGGEQEAHVPGWVNNGEGLQGEDVEKIWGGEGYMLAMTSKGQMLAWGSNAFNQFNRDDISSSSSPVLVGGLEQQLVVGGAAGGAAAFAICRPKQGEERAAVAATEVAPQEAAAEEQEPVASKQDESSKANAFPLIFQEEHRGELSEVAQDITAQLPQSGFDSQFLNPCWTSSGSSDISCLPQFFILGAARSGTQDFYNRLTVADTIVAASTPNPSWWDESADVPFTSYLELFNPAAAIIQSQNSSAVTGDASPTLLTNAGIKARGRARGFSLPEMIYAFLPAAKFIVIFRNPVDRFFSAFFTSPQPNIPNSNAADFAAHARDALSQMEACQQQEGGGLKGIAVCAKKLKGVIPELCNSVYFPFVEEWLRVFPKQQFLFIRFEDYIATKRAWLALASSFIMDSNPFRNKQTWVKAKALPVANQRQHGKDEVMDAETREKLNAFFEPLDHHLMNVTGNWRFDWD